jgi:phosphatidylglycerophosphatase A
LSRAPLNLRDCSASDKFICFLGLGLGSGLSPKAPGTAGSLLVLLLYPLWQSLGLGYAALLIVLMSLVGIYICGRTAELLQVHDDGRIVWDEFAGQSIALLPLLYCGCSAWWLVLAFVLFRIFDVWKPFPIGWADRQVAGGLGIMLDDVLAGLMAAAVFGAILFLVS